MSKRGREEKEEEEDAGETIYRDRKGRKLDLLQSFIALQEGKKKEKEIEYEWGTGSAQKQSQKEKREEEEREKSKPFARSVDDEDLDRLYRERIHFGDPMAKYVKEKEKKKDKKKSKKKEKKSKRKVVEKPVYRGPPPPPNRFNIIPGWRWDGVDRSNKFEEFFFKNQAQRTAVRDIAYKWSVEDM